MANLIDEIVSQKAFDELERLKRELAEAQKSIEAFYKQTGSMPKFGGSGTATSELEKMVALTKRLTEQIEVYGSVAGKALVEAQQAKRELVNETKLLVQQEQAEEGSINQLRASLNLLTKQYESMGRAAREGLGGKELHARIMATRTEVDKLEQSLGNYKRNVGNYTNATFQLSQVFRELPAFTFSATTGIMALSNNLPMLRDGFIQVAQATNKTTGEVNGTMGALKIFGSAIFSVGNLFTLAIAAVTIFSKEISTLFQNTNKLVDGQKELASAFDEGQKNAYAEQVSLNSLYTAMTDTNRSMDERLTAIKEIRDKYPAYFQDLTDEEMLTGKASEAYRKLSNDILSVARARAIESKIAKIYEDTLETELQLKENLRKASATEALDRNKEIDMARYSGLNKEKETFTLSAEAANKHRLDKKRIAQTELMDFMSSRQQQLKILEDAISKETLLLKPKPEKEKAKKEKEKKEKEPFKPEFRFDDNDYENIKKYYDELLKATEKVWNEVKPYFEKRIVEDIEDSMDSLVMPVLDPQEADKLNAQLMNRAKQNQQNLTDQKKAAEELKQLFSAIENLANSITQSLTTINDIINQRIIAQFDAREKKMNEYYDNEEYRIKSTMVNGVAKEEELMKIQAQRDAQQKKIDRERILEQRKGAAREKAISIGGIIANVALGITQALSDKGVAPYIRWLNAAAVGGVGAAQLAAVIAQPLPQFAKGTESSPEGYAVVGEKGHELVVEPSGKKWVTPAKDTITYLRKGSKVIPNDKLMTMVRDSAYVELASMNMPVTPDLYGKALVDQFERLSDDVKDLKAVMSNKDMRVNIVGNFDHYMHVKRNIK